MRFYVFVLGLFVRVEVYTGFLFLVLEVFVALG